MEKLGTKQIDKNASGNYVLATQTMATSQGFSKVNASWLSKCPTIEDVVQKCTEESKKIEDFCIPLSSWEPVIENGECRLKNKTNDKTYRVTKHAMMNLSVLSGMSYTLPLELTQPKIHTTKTDKDGNPLVIYKRDKGDGETLKRIFENSIFRTDRVDQKTTRLFRTFNDDNTIRAVLSSKYCIINSLFFLETISKIIPGSRMSHYKNDGDQLRANVLINDFIRTEDDSDFGGLLAINNSEIGTRNLVSLPGVFRCICQNGCIHQLQQGIAVKRKHVGNIDLNDLRKQIRSNIEKQIPLIGDLIDRQLATKTQKIGNIPLGNVFVQLANEQSLTKPQLKSVIENFKIEKDILGKNVFTLFGLVQSITRTSQTQSDLEDWWKLDEAAGHLIDNAGKWDKFLDRAKNVDQKVIEKWLGIAV